MNRCDKCGGHGNRILEKIRGHEVGYISCCRCVFATRKSILDGPNGQIKAWDYLESLWNSGCVHEGEYISLDGIAEYLAKSGYMPSVWCESLEEKEKEWKDELEFAMALGNLL